MMRRALQILVAVLAPSAASAQGNLSTQGLGYPPGQLSTKALTMGGASGESDAMSPLNPASISLLLTPIVAMQIEPEFRELSIGGKTQRTSVSRFPLFFASMPIGTRWGVAVSASTLFDRTWSTSSRASQILSPDTIRSTVERFSDGSIVDLRLAASYSVLPWLRVGLGAHGFSGQSALRTTHVFDDTLRFQADTQRTTVTYGGNAVSIGVQTLWQNVGAVGFTYRRGGDLRTYDGNTISRAGSAPDHLGFSAVYLGIDGTALAFRVASDKWSRAAGLSPTLHIHEGLDLGVGADVTGPRWGSSSVSLRGGLRWRTLPFSVGTEAVKEHTWSLGFGVPLARQLAELNVGVLRSTRSAYSADEKAWTLSTGFSVRP